MAAQKAPQAPGNRRTTYQGAGARSTARGSVVTTQGGGSTTTINPGAFPRRPFTPGTGGARPAAGGAAGGRASSTGARPARSSRPAGARPMPGTKTPQGGSSRRAPGLRLGGGNGYRNYQGIIMAEFVAAELLAAAMPMATRKNQPGLSPYVPRDMVKLAAIGLVYLLLELMAVGGRGTGRFAAWFGALVLLAVGLNEAADLAKVFAFLSGGTGNEPKTTAQTLAAGPPSGLQTFIGNEPTLGTSEPSTASSSGGPSTGGGTGPKSGTSFVQEAGKFIGTPYKWGGAAPGGFDCSGLVQYALERMGLKNVPRTSEQQWGWVQRISQSELAPGDLIFEQWPGEASPGHVAIYAGNGQIIQAPAPGQDVQKVHWSPSIVHSQGGQIVGFGRVPGLSYGAPVKVL